MNNYIFLTKIKQNGFTLVEVIIALGISTIAILGALTLYVNTVRENTIILDQIRLNYSLRNSMSMMATHIRRAGYWSNVQSQIFDPSIENPFMTTSSTAANNTVITVYNSTTPATTGDCILFAYNVSESPTLPSAGSNPDDRFGFRLNNGVIQSRVPSSQFSCNANDSSWADITDPNRVTVDSLTFTEESNQMNIGNGDFFTTKSILIQITARLTNNSNVSATVSQRANVKSGIFTD